MSREAMKLALEEMKVGNYNSAAERLETALAEQPAPMQSWKLVPVEPTKDMWRAVNKLDDEMAAGSYDGKGCSIEQAWDCLLAAAPQPAQQKPVNLRRGDLLRCIETDELCTVWATSTTGNTLIKWSANNFGDYTAEQIGELFWLEPAQQEPVAFVKGCNRGQWEIFPAKAYQIFEREQPLYTTPPQRTWVNATTWRGLTDEEVMEIAFNFDVPSLVVRTVEAKLEEKNT